MLFEDLKKGDLVEYDTVNGEVGTGMFGVFTGERNGDDLEVDTTEGVTRIHAGRLAAYAWGGWMPDELEPVWAKYDDEDELDFDW